ncbi:MAG: tagaturonate epimerase family protein [Paracholeplasma sp.]|nr:tagaturonate epimerase family protein [Paracholeplasma sp.]MDY3196313.1 tagaturonate epimerase family protein [Paracholeplasma sp.]
MQQTKETILKELASVDGIKEAIVYEKSINQVSDTWVFMQKKETVDELIAYGSLSSKFEGKPFMVFGKPGVIAPLSSHNANVLRELFSFTKPVPVLHQKRSFGLGDRLGLATEGHARVFEKYDAYPIFAQQSIRELNMTNRTYEDVLNSATFGVYKVGFKRGFGADGDHLKTKKDIEYALSLGFTMITLDASEHIRNDVNRMSKKEILNQDVLSDELKGRYLNQSFNVSDQTITFSEYELKRSVLVYLEAITFVEDIYNTFFRGKKNAPNFELSIDETETPTTPVEHYFVANELALRGIKVDTLAPRFCGEFQKGIDYIGDINQFEQELIIHVAIAEHFGYKLSIHSGSDKFSIFELIGKHTKGHFHVKTAGTNWLEAVRVVSMKDPGLYRELHAYALSMFKEATKFYHVTTNINNIPSLDSLKDEELPSLMNHEDARQLIHITYGFILNHKDSDGNFVFKDRLYLLWRQEMKTYNDRLESHIGKHLELLYQGFKA